MKIKTKNMAYEKVIALPRKKHKNPWRPSFLLSTVIRVGSLVNLLPVRFSYEKHGMEKLDPKEPVLILMNHSCFLDPQIVYNIFYPKPFSIVVTNDALTGKEFLMRWLGCIPTQKFSNDITLIRDMEYMLKQKKTSVLMYPEAGYSFDGTATDLPRKMGVLLKKLGVSVVTVITEGAFTRTPLYNNLKNRKVNVRADVTCLCTAQEIKEMTVAQLDAKISEAFGFDNFAWQRDNNILITEPDRADGLNRILYRCPHCQTEGQTEGKGIHWTCHSCGAKYELLENGQLKGVNVETKISHIPDWYAWERQEVRKSIEDGTYLLDTDVDIGMMVDFKAVYMVGSGHLTHNCEGFRLTGCDGKLSYTQSPLANHSLYSDYYWYEIGDVICIGNNEITYCCFPKGCGDVVAKTRQAAEELYKLKKRRRAPANATLL